jgi:hypothetical protein
LILTDSIIKAPATVTPTASSIQNNTSVTNNGTQTLVDFTWTAVTHATSYDWQVAYDAAFTNLAKTGTSTGVSASQVQLIPGKTYYWRVRVSAGSPMASLWSDGVQFTTAVVSSTSQGIDEVGRIYPVNGASIPSTTLTFTWGSVASADSYDFKLMKDGTAVVTKTGLTDTFYAATGLVAGGQYTWQVRAISGGVAGGWVTSAFTTTAAVTGITSGGGGTTAVSGGTTTIINPTPVVNISPATYTITSIGGHCNWAGRRANFKRILDNQISCENS